MLKVERSFSPSTAGPSRLKLPGPFRASVAQLDRASDFGSEGYRFKSCRTRQVWLFCPIGTSCKTRQLPCTMQPMQLNQLAENLWEIDRPLKVPGLSIGHRMTVVRLRNGDLWVHSPVELEHWLPDALAQLGTVR